MSSSTSSIRTVIVLLAIGSLYVQGVVAKEVDPKGAAYLQLTFSPSAEDCKAKKQSSKADAAHDVTAQCFSNATPPSDRRRLPDYLFQVTSSKTALQPASSPSTFTYRSLGPIQLAKNQSGANPTPPGNGEVKFYQMMVFSNPATPEQDAAYNDWYDHQHVPDVMRNAGFISGQRFVRIDNDQGKEVQLPHYLVIFTLKSGDLKATGEEIGARIRDGRTRMSPAFGTEGGAGMFVTPLK